MSRVVKRSASGGVKSGPSRRSTSRSDSPLPRFIPPQLSQLVEKAPSAPQWPHEIKLDGFRMAARIDNGRAQLLTRTGLDSTSATRASPTGPGRFGSRCLRGCCRNSSQRTGSAGGGRIQGWIEGVVAYASCLSSGDRSGGYRPVGGWSGARQKRRDLESNAIEPLA